LTATHGFLCEANKIERTRQASLKSADYKE